MSVEEYPSHEEYVRDAEIIVKLMDLAEELSQRPFGLMIGRVDLKLLLLAADRINAMHATIGHLKNRLATFESNGTVKGERTDE